MSDEVKKKHGWQQARTLKCKILLPKFNTWEQVHLERKKGSLPLFDNTVGGFSAHDGRRYGAIASPLQCNRNAVTVQSHRRYSAIAPRLHRNGDAFLANLERQNVAKNITA